jgi:hypothetical protein
VPEVTDDIRALGHYVVGLAIKGANFSQGCRRCEPIGYESPSAWVAGAGLCHRVSNGLPSLGRRPLAEDLDPLRPEPTRVTPFLDCVIHLGQKIAEVIAAEQFMELGDGPQSGASDLIEGIG